MTERHLFTNPEIKQSHVSPEKFERLLELQSNILGMAASSCDCTGLAEKLCLLAEQLEPESVASIMLRNQSDNCMYVHSGPSLPIEAIEALNGLAVGKGSCGNVVAHNDEMFVSNTLQDKRWDDLRGFAEKFNVLSCWASPVRNDANEVIGSFALSSFQVSEPNSFQQTLLRICASIAGILIQKEKYLEQSKELEKESLKSQKLESIGVLAGGIAHDFNNLLGIIIGNLDLAIHKTDQHSKVRAYLESAERASSKAIHLAQQLLTFSKGGSPVKKPTNIKTLLHESAKFVLHGSNVSLEFNCRQCDACDNHQPSWRADLDSGQISQVVQNLVLNARQAMQDGGRIKITCDLVSNTDDDNTLFLRPGDYFKIDIEDTGRGIPEDIIDKIFDPYFTTKAGGSGLGLSLAYSIINKHGGHIYTRSTAGEGACFTIYLPAKYQTAADLNDIYDEKSQSTTQHKGRVMIVDDQEMIREVAHAMLEELGYEVIHAEEGSVAIDMYKSAMTGSNPIDLTIMDLTIPGGMGGKEAVKEILALEPNAKIIVCSGFSTDSVMSRYKEFGFQAAINKPYKFEELEKTITTVMYS